MSYFADQLPWAVPPVCPICERRHYRHLPHDQGSAEWIDFCLEVYGRWPTWHDAMRHCPAHIRAYCREQLILGYLTHNWPIPAELCDADWPLAASGSRAWPTELGAGPGD